MRHSILFFLLATACGVPAAISQAAHDRGSSAPQSGATESLGFGSHDSNAPIDISSNNFDYDLNAKVGVYRGNVLAIQGDMRLRADTMKVNIAQGKPTRIEAAGRVIVNAPNGTATGDNGVYELGPRTITMTGHVILTKEKDVMRGTKLVMDLNTNLAHMYAQGMPGGRVQGLFIPPPQKEGDAGAAAQEKKTIHKSGKKGLSPAAGSAEK